MAGVVLALDLGTKAGWACRNKDGLIQSGAATFNNVGHGGHRFLRFRAWLTNVKNGLGGIDAVFYERVEFISTVENARTKYGFEGTLLAWCEHHEIPYSGTSPGAIKKFATGSGRADKRAVRDGMRLRCPSNAVATYDEADALALLMLALERMECGRAA